MLAMPTVEAWPELDALPHWRADTEGIRATQSEYPPKSRLAEHVQQQATMSWAGITTECMLILAYQHVPECPEAVLKALPHGFLTVLTNEGNAPLNVQCAAAGYQPCSLALELLAQLLEMNPARRITAKRALQHPYFQQARRAALRPGPARIGLNASPTPLWVVPCHGGARMTDSS